MPTQPKYPSPRAADQAEQLARDGRIGEAFDELGATDCPEGCFVEPDGWCSHGYKSAGLTMGVI